MRRKWRRRQSAKPTMSPAEFAAASRPLRVSLEQAKSILQQSLSQEKLSRRKRKELSRALRELDRAEGYVTDAQTTIGKLSGGQ